MAHGGVIVPWLIPPCWSRTGSSRQLPKPLGRVPGFQIDHGDGSYLYIVDVVATMLLVAFLDCTVPAAADGLTVAVSVFTALERRGRRAVAAGGGVCRSAHQQGR